MSNHARSIDFTNCHEVIEGRGTAIITYSYLSHFSEESQTLNCPTRHESQQMNQAASWGYDCFYSLSLKRANGIPSLVF